jgi:hypothetical protein
MDKDEPRPPRCPRVSQSLTRITQAPAAWAGFPRARAERQRFDQGRDPGAVNKMTVEARCSAIHFASRFNRRATCIACQCRLPAGVGIPRSSRAAARSFRLVIPAARSSAITGARSAATRLARAMRALSAMLGARWPKWRPVGVAPVYQSSVNSSPISRVGTPGETLTPLHSNAVSVHISSLASTRCTCTACH